MTPEPRLAIAAPPMGDRTARQTEALADLAGRAPIGLALLAADGTTITANPAFIELIGVEPVAGGPRAIDLDAASIATVTRPTWSTLDGGPGAVAAAIDAARAGRGQQLVVGGQDRRLRVTLEPAPDGAVSVAVEDITAAARVSDDLARAAAQFRAAFDHAPIGMAIVGTDRRFRRVNTVLCAILGYSPTDLIRRLVTDVIAVDDIGAVDELLARTAAGALPQGRVVLRVDHAHGAHRWIAMVASAVAGSDGAVQHFVVQVQDVTAQHAAEQALRDKQEELSWRATHDDLTGLPNRRLLIEHLDLAVRRFRRNRHGVAVLFGDLDGFKPINDALGHHAGDVVLVSVAHRLTAACRDSDVVARYGGDEFVMVCEGVQRDEEARCLAERLISIVGAPIEISGADPVSVGISLGVAIAGLDDAPTTLLERADAALYRAKATAVNPTIALPLAPG